MRIAIIGTRGIPNNYGGFEQLAQWLSRGLHNKGHDVYVYSSHSHPYRGKSWNGVNIIHCYDPEHKLGTVGQFIYDFNCIRDSRKREFDVILNLGYTSSSVWMRLFPKKALLITNMDGLEWKRTKYSEKVKYFLRHAEKWAVKKSSLLVADSRFISDYIYNMYKIRPHYIAYGAELFNNPDESVLKPFNVKPFGYNMIIARMEPENNIEMILDGVHMSGKQTPFFVVGNSENKFGKYLKNKFARDSRIVFKGPIYDSAVLNNLRHFSGIYFHGHSVGGTNPSLLEAMGCRCFIAANDNEFNKAVLGDDCFYFTKAGDIPVLLDECNRYSESSARFMDNNFEKIRNSYSWPAIIDAYENLMLSR